jgi:hypothetical protein
VTCVAPLETELHTFQQNKRQLLETAAGKYALIKDSEVEGTYDTRAAAIEAGYSKFGNEEFLVKQIVEVEPPQTFISNVLIRR